MTGENEAAKKKSGRARRVAGFLARRGGLNRAFDGARLGGTFIGETVRKLRPGRLDGQGFVGRYGDGGVDRFRKLTQGMSEFELGDQYRGWCVQRACFQYAALGAILTIPLGIVFLQMSKYLVFGLVALFLFALFRAIRADFFAWILEQGRFGGFLDYLGSRLPRNMQIIVPDRHRDGGAGGT